MAHFAPLIAKNLGVKKAPITYSIKGKTRSAEIPGILHMSVDPLPTAHPSGEMWANVGHPVSPEKLAFAVGAPGNTFSDHGMRWETPARMVTTRRSGGQALLDNRICSRSHFAPRTRYHHRRARGSHCARLVRPRLDGMEMTGYRMIPAGQALMMPASSPWQPFEFSYVFACGL
jgi:Protein of unknown function (DUF1326)